MSESKKRVYETSSEEDSALASKGSAAAIKRKKVPSQKFLPACHEAYPCLVPLRKGSKLVLCTTCRSDFYHASMAASLRNLLRLSPTRSSADEKVFSIKIKSYKEFSRLESFFHQVFFPFSLSLPFSLSFVLMQ